MEDLFKFACTLVLMTVLISCYVAVQLIIVTVTRTLLPTWAFVIVLGWLVYINYRVFLKGGEY
ncbi:putative membrane protein [Enterococcus phage VD13]|uniref:Putative membrane protein n=1 Tax=Enterococcus phage VD13 TaxID=1458851 RepID=X2KRV7_9CAUD|nr:hypothetical protein X878_0070 [Enterococcus phage VD13]YP_009592512.1 hypothetical protein FDG77_gp71 [Enterococcus phage VD13]AHL19656.1 hypothetical protein VD13_071 [Enterococcus phage VD13]AHN83158.1 putative membrane protein [Enterococcus phage VD13]